MSKEIASHIMKFIEWKDLNTMSDKISKNEMKYMISDFSVPAKWITLGKLYQYWLTEINK
jgi:hypothetical protein